MKISSNTCQSLRIASTKLCGKNACLPLADIKEQKLRKAVVIPPVRCVEWEREMNTVYV